MKVSTFFCLYLDQTEHENVIVRELKNIFREMASKDIVKSSEYIRNFNLPNYTFGNQHDAHECITHILNHCFLEGNDNMFQIMVKESIICEVVPGSFNTGCNKRIEKDVPTNVLSLEVKDTNEEQSIQSLLETLFSPYGCSQEDYRCEREPGNGGCGKRGYCTKASLLTNITNMLLIQLKIFRNDLYGHTWKITQFETLSLKGIIWHNGQNLTSGHYTVSVKRGGIWYLTDDQSVSEFEKFYSKLNRWYDPVLVGISKI